MGSGADRLAGYSRGPSTFVDETSHLLNLLSPSLLATLALSSQILYNGTPHNQDLRDVDMGAFTCCCFSLRCSSPCSSDLPTPASPSATNTGRGLLK